MVVTAFTGRRMDLTRYAAGLTAPNATRRSFRG